MRLPDRPEPWPGVHAPPVCHTVPFAGLWPCRLHRPIRTCSVGDDRRAHEVDRVSLDVGNQDGVPGPIHPFSKGEIHNLKWIAAPLEHVSTQLVDVLRPPCGLSGGGRHWSCHEGGHGVDHIRLSRWFGFAGEQWVHQEHVHVTVGVTVTTCRRTEGTGIEGLRPPAAEFFPHSTPELDPKISHGDGNGGSDVLPIELVDPIPPHLHGLNQPLVDQSGQASPYADLRSAHRLSGHFAHRKGTARTGQHGKNRSVQCGCDRPRGVSHVHDHIV